MCCLTLRERHGEACDCPGCNQMYGNRVTQASRDAEDEDKVILYERQRQRFLREAKEGDN